SNQPRRRYPAGILDGPSQTIFLAETLKGDGNTRAVDVHRQHVVLPAKEGAMFKGDKLGDMGVQDFKEGKHIAGDHYASWMDGRAMESTVVAGRGINDERPDAFYEDKEKGRIGVMGPRSLDMFGYVGLGDGSVRSLSQKVSYETWHNALTPDADDLVPAPGK